MNTEEQNSTPKNLFSTTISDFFIASISEHLSEWLKTSKNLNVTTEEICGAFDLKYNKKIVTGTTMPNMSNYVKKKPRKTRKKVDPNAKKCIYIFTRGNSEGDKCNETVLGNETPGSDDYCKGCIKKKKVKLEIQKKTSNSSKIQPPKLPGKSVSVVTQNDEPEQEYLDVEAIDGYTDMFKERNHGFIIKKYPDESLLATCVEENGIQRPLNADETRTAIHLGLSIMNSPVPEQNDVIEDLPTMDSNISSLPNMEIPQVPQINPTMSNIPPQPVSMVI